MNKAETKGFFNRLHKANTVYQEHEISPKELEAIYLNILDEYATEESREGMKCHSCGDPLSNECSRCKRLWET